MYSLLQKKPKVETKPYPHVVIEDALPWELYEELENTAKLALILTGQNPRLLNNKNVNDVINKFEIKWD